MSTSFRRMWFRPIPPSLVLPPLAGEVASANRASRWGDEASPSGRFATTSPPPKSLGDFGQSEIAGREAAGGGRGRKEAREG